MIKNRIESWQVTLYVVFASQLLSMVAFSFVFPFMPLYVEELGVQDPGEAAFWAGALTAAQGASMFIMSPIWGILADRWERKPMLLRATLAAGIVVAIMGLATNVYQLLFLRFLQGIFTGTASAAMALVAGETPRSKLPYATGLIQMALFVGNTVGPLGGGVLSHTLGFRTTFFITSATLFVASALIAVLVREQFKPAKDAPTVSFKFWDNYRLPGSSGQVLPIMGVIFLVYAGPSIVSPIIPLDIQNLAGQSSAALLSGVAISAMGLTGALSATLAGIMSERFDIRLVLLLSCLGAGVFFLAGGFVFSVATLVFVLALVGFCRGGMVTSSTALLGLVVPRERHGAAYGIAQSAQAAGFGLGPLFGGIMASLVGIKPVFLVTGLAFLAITFYVSRAISAVRTTKA